MNNNLKIKLQMLPDNPGCYLMKDIDNNVIYVGKAKNLKKRVNQYFTGVHDYKTTKLVLNINDFDFILTTSEKEALLLENNLIKKYNPRYNILLTDDKTYPYIKLILNKYPMLKIVRETKKNAKDKYFGPYPDVTSAKNTIDLLNEIYPLRKCNVLPNKLCLYYHIKQCLGYCIYDIDNKDIEIMINEIISFLNGNTTNIIKQLEKQMNINIDNLEYEKASKQRDMINSINNTIDKQNVDLIKLKNVDIFNYYEDKGYLCIAIILVRNSKLLDKNIILVPIYNDVIETIISYLQQYYDKNQYPNEIILPKLFKDNYLEDILECKISYPNHGLKKSLLDITYTNALNYHKLNFNIIFKKQENNNNLKIEFNNIFNKNINTIEIFDNSNIQGTNNVSGMVVYKDFKPSKKDYRLYKINDQINDIKSMKEVIYRRYYRILKDNLESPDLIIVDGGKNQIKVCKDIIDELGLDIIVCGLVKDNKHNTEGLLMSDYTLIDIDKKSDLFFFLTNMQDEVHRFALTYHQKLRSKSQTKSILDDIVGLGSSRKAILLKTFKTISAIKVASIDELSKVVPNNVAINIFNKFNK